MNTSELSCYTANLAGYLAAEISDAAGHLARSIRLAVRIDLGANQLAFSHHRQSLDQLPDGTVLRYAGAEHPAEALTCLADELASHGRVLVVTDSAHLPWSPSFRQPEPAPHWLLVDDRRPGLWHVVDDFSGLLPTGTQQPFVGWLRTAELVRAMTPAGEWTPQQRQRNVLAFGFPVPPPDPVEMRWLRREPGGSAVPRLGGAWLTEDEAVLPFLSDYFIDRPADAVAYLDDVWAAARHRAFRHRWRRTAYPETSDATALVEAAEGWLRLPQALRFAIDSARRNRPRPSLIRTIFAHLLEIEMAHQALPTRGQ